MNDVIMDNICDANARKGTSSHMEMSLMHKITYKTSDCMYLKVFFNVTKQPVIKEGGLSHG